MFGQQPIRLLIATGNAGKMREYAELLAGLPFKLVSLSDMGISHTVDETGKTFEENAWLKASEYAALSGILTLADDSGLEVDALGGDPGVRSARYGGDSCHNDQDRIKLLLKNLQDVPWEKRTARFRCVIAVAKFPDAPIYPDLCRQVEEVAPKHKGRSEGDLAPVLVTQSEGQIDGMIQYKEEGEDGFGYDPVFYIPSHDKTLAEIPLSEKNLLSHRGNAAKITVESLQKLISKS